MTTLDWIDQTAPSGKCDFCSALDPEWVYPTNEFFMPDVIVPDAAAGSMWGSSGAWAACERCSELIEKEDWVKLAKVGVATQQALVSALPRDMRPMIRLEVLKLHRRFREERRGERRRFG